MRRTPILENRKGSRVHLGEEGRGRPWIICAGCPRPVLVRGLGTAEAALRQHARDCDR
jgi:hypothetical protein